MTDKIQDTEPRTAAKHRLRHATVSVGASVREAADNVTSSIQAGIAQASRKAAAVGKGTAEKVSSAGASAIVDGFAVAGESLAKLSKNLDWSAVDPSMFVYAGTRGAGRSLEEARLVWESIPERLRALGPEEVEKQLDGLDWSHIIPFSKGGGNEAANGIFELAELNRSRGAEPMTAAELDAANNVLLEKAFESALQEAAATALAGAGVGAVVSCVISCLEFGLAYQRSEITEEELHRNIVKEVAKSAVVGGSVAGILTAVALMFPALIPVAAPLVMPLMFLGFCALGYKFVLLGKGWYGLIRARSVENSRDAMPDIIFLPNAAAPE